MSLDADLPVTEATLNYLAESEHKPVSYTYTPPSGPAPRVRTERHRVAIRDARKLAAAATLDREGFERVAHPTAVRDFLDEAELRSRYYAEVESLLRAVTGA